MPDFNGIDNQHFDPMKDMLGVLSWEKKRELGQKMEA